MVARVMAQLAFGPTLPERQSEACSRLLARPGLALFRLRNYPPDDMAPFLHAMVREGNEPGRSRSAAIGFTFSACRNKTSPWQFVCNWLEE